MGNRYQVPKGLAAIKECRVCGKSELMPVLSLGMQYLSNFVDDPDQELYAAPVELVLCSKEGGGCGLLQLKHTVPPDLLYRKFWYKSGTNQTMKDALDDIVSKAKKLVRLQAGDIVLDIGANDGTLLRSYGRRDLKLAGFEPATNLMEEARIGTTKIFNDFFNHAAFENEFHTQAKIITSIAMFYDLEKPNEFVSDIVKTLHKEGVWIVQMNYLATMLENNAFDNIVHEHLEYYSLGSLENLLERHGLVVFDVELNDVNGGSIRTYIKHKDCKLYPISNRVDKTRSYEDKMGLEDYQTYQKFATRLENLKEKTYNFVKAEVDKGRTVHVYGASTRGNTLLQYYNLDYRLIKAAADRNPVKWGKRTAGTHIYIISEEQARKERPDYFLVLPWYFIDEFVSREKEFLKSGGKFIVPLPDFNIIQKAREAPKEPSLPAEEYSPSRTHAGHGRTTTKRKRTSRRKV